LTNIQEKIDQVGGVIINDIKEKKEISKNIGQVENLANKDPRQAIKIERVIFVFAQPSNTWVKKIKTKFKLESPN